MSDETLINRAFLKKNLTILNDIVLNYKLKWKFCNPNRIYRSMINHTNIKKIKLHVAEIA